LTFKLFRDYLFLLVLLTGLSFMLMVLLDRMRGYPMGPDFFLTAIFPAINIVVAVVLISRAAGYAESIFVGAEQLMHVPELSILLPEDLKPVQDDLNRIRERFIGEKRRAELAEQRKNDLIVYLAHDLKTPLTSVIGYLSLLDEAGDLPVESRARCTGIALEKAYRLEALINEFFEITRFNLSTLELSIGTIDVNRLLEQVMSEFLPIMSEKSLIWSAALDPKLKLEGDVNLLERILDNLIRNAIAYSYPNTRLLLSAHTAEGRLVLSLTNSGATIPPAKLDHLFDQFFRADSARSSRTGGSGLGLAIAKAIAERHHGRIIASSADEQITFTLMLPLKQPVQQEKLQQRPSDKDEAALNR